VVRFGCPLTATQEHYNLTPTTAQGQQKSSAGTTNEQQGSNKQQFQGSKGAPREQQGSSTPIAKIYESGVCKIGGAPGEHQPCMKPAPGLHLDMKKSNKGATKAAINAKNKYLTNVIYFRHW
jgi:hypothetical protein